MGIVVISGRACEIHLHFLGQLLSIVDHAVVVLLLLLLKRYVRMVTMTRLFLRYHTVVLQTIWVDLPIFTVDAHLRRFLSFVDLGQPDIFMALLVSSR